MASAQAAWNSVLSRVNINDVGAGYSAAQQGDMLEVFYTAMYRASLFPRKLWEIDASGNPVHWCAVPCFDVMMVVCLHVRLDHCVCGWWWWAGLSPESSCVLMQVALMIWTTSDDDDCCDADPK